MRHADRLSRMAAIALLLLTAAAPVATALDSGRSLTQALHRIWQVQQGLPRATIYAVGQTSDGYLWLGTQTGLVRFDGVRFVSIREAARSGGVSLEGCWISDVTEDSRHALWAATEGSGVFRLGDGDAKQYTRQDGLPTDTVHRLFFDSTGTLWVGTASGLAVLRGERFATITDGVPATAIRAIGQSGDHTLWVGGDGGLFVSPDGTHFSRKEIASQPGSTVNDLTCLADGAVWIASGAGLIAIHGGDVRRFTTVNGLPDDRVLCVAAGRDGGSIWAGTRDGFARIRDGEVESFRSRDGLSQSTVYALIEDREGTLWVGTKHGLNQFLDRRTVPFTASEGLPSNNTGPVLAASAPEGTWVGTLDAGLARFDGRRFNRLTKAQGLPSDTVRALSEGAAGELWVGTSAGAALVRHDRVEQTVGLGQGLPSADVRCLYRDRGGALWIGTSAGLVELRDGRAVEATSAAGPLRQPILAMTGLPDGRLLAAVGGGAGLFTCVDGRLQPYGPGSGDALPPNDVVAFYRDADQNTWIGTLGGGLLLLDGTGRLTRYTVRDGLFDDDVYGIVADDQDRLWMACSKGIFSVPRTELIRFAGGQLRALVSAPFSPTDAQRTIECKPQVQPVACRTPDGRLWFATVRGVIVVDPARSRPKLSAPNAVVETTIVDGKNESADDLQRLSAGPHNFEFRYTGLSLVAPSRITFRYKLDGFDPDWVDAANRREAFYTNLPPGSYRFQVMATNADGTVGETSTPVAFTVPAHYYQRPWFIPACLLALLGISAMAYRARVRRMRERLDTILVERGRIARELHDTLLQGFSGVTMEMQALSARLPSGSDERESLHEIIRDAGTCMREARRSVAGLRDAPAGGQRPDGAGADDLVGAITRAATQLTETTRIRLKLDLRPPRQAPEPEVQYNLVRIAQEAVTNAVRHARPRSIEVTLDDAEDQMRLSIRDDGSGFDAHATASTPESGTADNGHWGLIGMRERAAQIGATLTLQSAPGRGTLVRVSLPLPVRSANRHATAQQTP
ncbi:MAG TPA: two-component regulator propeller domain-containing protein [Tepidisphaeraceae bacterium]